MFSSINGLLHGNIIINNKSAFLLHRFIFICYQLAYTFKKSTYLHLCSFLLLSFITSFLPVYHILSIRYTYGVAKPRCYSSCNKLHCTTPKLPQHMHVIGTDLCYWILFLQGLFTHSSQLSPYAH